jgi:hypothetical protein
MLKPLAGKIAVCKEADGVDCPLRRKKQPTKLVPVKKRCL